MEVHTTRRVIILSCTTTAIKSDPTHQHMCNCMTNVHVYSVYNKIPPAQLPHPNPPTHIPFFWYFLPIQIKVVIIDLCMETNLLNSEIGCRCMWRCRQPGCSTHKITHGTKKQKTKKVSPSRWGALCWKSVNVVTRYWMVPRPRKLLQNVLSIERDIFC